MNCPGYEEQLICSLGNSSGSPIQTLFALGSFTVVLDAWVVEEQTLGLKEGVGEQFLLSPKQPCHQKFLSLVHRVALCCLAEGLVCFSVLSCFFSQLFHKNIKLTPAGFGGVGGGILHLSVVTS